MTWYANQIYAFAEPAVIAAFRIPSFLADQMYPVDDFRGVRDPSTRAILESKDSARRDLGHGLPEGGLLVVSPEIYKNGFLPYTKRFLIGNSIN